MCIRFKKKKTIIPIQKLVNPPPQALQ